MPSLRWLQWNVRPEQRKQLVDWRGVPEALRRQATAVVRNPREAEDLLLFYGSADYQPTGGVVLLIPGQPPVYVSNVRRVQTGNVVEPVGLTALQLRDIAAEMWWAVIGEVMNDPDQGRFNLDTLAKTPNQLKWRVLEKNRLGRILADAQNKILHPPVQSWQEQRLTVVR